MSREDYLDPRCEPDYGRDYEADYREACENAAQALDVLMTNATPFAASQEPIPPREPVRVRFHAKSAAWCEAHAAWFAWQDAHAAWQEANR